MRNTKVGFNPEKLNKSAEILRALTHPLRMKILKFIDGHEKIHVNKIYNTLNLEQSITSQHLKILRLAGLVDTMKEGKFVYYSINYDIMCQSLDAVNIFLEHVNETEMSN